MATDLKVNVNNIVSGNTGNQITVTGGKLFVAPSTSTGGLTSVAHDSTLTGDGTQDSLLGVSNIIDMENKHLRLSSGEVVSIYAHNGSVTESNMLFTSDGLIDIDALSQISLHASVSEAHLILNSGGVTGRHSSEVQNSKVMFEGEYGSRVTPTHTAADAGKVLSVNSSNNLVWQGPDTPAPHGTCFAMMGSQSFNMEAKSDDRYEQNYTAWTGNQRSIGDLSISVSNGSGDIVIENRASSRVLVKLSLVAPVTTTDHILWLDWWLYTSSLSGGNSYTWPKNAIVEESAVRTDGIWSEMEYMVLSDLEANSSTTFNLKILPGVSDANPPGTFGVCYGAYKGYFIAEIIS